MSTPIRFQLSRKRGWRMPPNTVKVDRSTKWGNPFHGTPKQRVVMAFRKQLQHVGYYWWHDEQVNDYNIRETLRGKNLACWCPLDEACHADVLLEIANAPD